MTSVFVLISDEHRGNYNWMCEETNRVLLYKWQKIYRCHCEYIQNFTTGMFTTHSKVIFLNWKSLKSSKEGVIFSTLLTSSKIKTFPLSFSYSWLGHTTSNYRIRHWIVRFGAENQQFISITRHVRYISTSQLNRPYFTPLPSHQEFAQLIPSVTQSVDKQIKLGNMWFSLRGTFPRVTPRVHWYLLSRTVPCRNGCSVKLVTSAHHITVNRVIKRDVARHCSLFNSSVRAVQITCCAPFKNDVAVKCHVWNYLRIIWIRII